MFNCIQINLLTLFNLELIAYTFYRTLKCCDVGKVEYKVMAIPKNFDINKGTVYLEAISHNLWNYLGKPEGKLKIPYKNYPLALMDENPSVKHFL